MVRVEIVFAMCVTIALCCLCGCGGKQEESEVAVMARLSREARSLSARITEATTCEAQGAAVGQFDKWSRASSEVTFDRDEGPRLGVTLRRVVAAGTAPATVPWWASAIHVSVEWDSSAKGRVFLHRFSFVPLSEGIAEMLFLE